MNKEKQNLLKIEDLFVEYTSEGEIIHAVNGIHLELEEGKTLGLVGETGAGKTSIAKAILRVLPDPPARIKSGKIFFEGEDMLSLSEEQMLKLRGAKISMIFQDPMTALNPVQTVGDQIAEVIRLHNDVTKKEAEEKAMEMLQMVGITRERYHEFPFQFSGGMKQRIVIAIALACRPKLLLADEPTTALDVTIQAQILEMMRKLQKELNMSLILITHDLGVVAQMCDDVAVVYGGEIIEYGSRNTIFTHPAHPYTIGLFKSLPGFAVGERRLHPIEGLPPDPSNLPEGCSFAPRCPYGLEDCECRDMEMYELEPGHLCRCIYPREEDELCLR